MKIRDAYNNLLDETDKGLNDHYNLYKNAVHGELGKRNTELYNNLMKAIKAFNCSVEDEIICEINSEMLDEYYDDENVSLYKQPLDE